jgi:hypothetical protein
MKICVDRCVCFDRSFDELSAIARTCGATSLEALQEETEFGLACRICNPYVRRMLRTGQTVFEELLTDVDEPRTPAGADTHKG